MSEMMKHRTFGKTIKKFFSFDKREINAILIGAFILAFIVSFRDWGVIEFSFDAGLKNYINAFLIILLSLLTHISAQKIIGLRLGFKVIYKLWGLGLLVALLVCFISNGVLWLILPGGIIIQHLAVHRLGYFRYGTNLYAFGITSAAGPFSNLFLAMLFKVLYGIAPTPLLWKAMVVNIWFACVTFLPIPPLDGSHMIYFSRLIYFFLYVTIFLSSIFLLYMNPLAALALAMVLGAILWFFYMLKVEKALD